MNCLTRRSGAWAYAVLVFAVCAPLSGHCQIYVGTSGSDDTIVLSNFSSAETPDVLVAAPLDATVVETVRQDAGPPTKLRVRAPEQWMVIINTISRQLGVSPQLLRAVIAVESNFDPMAMSRRGAVGLMQVMPATGRRFGVDDLVSPRSNVLAGATYLKFLMGLFDGDLELTLAAYNAGERAVLNAGRRVPNYPETHSYVRRVMARLRDDGAVANVPGLLGDARRQERVAGVDPFR